MMVETKQNMTLKVCLEDVGTHNKAILDFFFTKLGQHIFQQVDSQQAANTLIIDYDYPPARQRFEVDYKDWQKPALILSIAPVALDNVIWLAKPLTSRALLEAAEKIQVQLRDGISHSDPVPAAVSETPVSPITDIPTESQVPAKAVEQTTRFAPPVQRPEKKPATAPVNLPLVKDAKEEAAAESTSAPTPVAYRKSLLSESEQAQRWIDLCGERDDVPTTTDVEELQGDDRFFLSSLKDAVRLARQCQQGVMLDFPQLRIYVLPEIHRVFCAIDLYSDEFIRLTRECNAGQGGKMHILSTKEIHELNDMIAQQTSALYDLEAFLWSSALLSSQGLLSRGLDPTQAVGLRHWPGLTRIEHFPHVMSIAAQWSVAAISAFEVARSLNIPQRYVFSFYNAANALGLIEQDPDKLIKKKSVPRTTEAPRGLFSRLLKRLIGG
jgi:hypothetical protein